MKKSYYQLYHESDSVNSINELTSKTSMNDFLLSIPTVMTKSIDEQEYFLHLLLKLFKKNDKVKEMYCQHQFIIYLIDLVSRSESIQIYSLGCLLLWNINCEVNEMEMENSIKMILHGLSICSQDYLSINILGYLQMITQQQQKIRKSLIMKIIDQLIEIFYTTTSTISPLMIVKTFNNLLLYQQLHSYHKEILCDLVSSLQYQFLPQSFDEISSIHLYFLQSFIQLITILSITVKSCLLESSFKSFILSLNHPFLNESISLLLLHSNIQRNEIEEYIINHFDITNESLTSLLLSLLLTIESMVISEKIESLLIRLSQSIKSFQCKSLLCEICSIHQFSNSSSFLPFLIKTFEYSSLYSYSLHALDSLLSSIEFSSCFISNGGITLLLTTFQITDSLDIQKHIICLLSQILKYHNLISIDIYNQIKTIAITVKSSLLALLILPFQYSFIEFLPLVYHSFQSKDKQEQYGGLYLIKGMLHSKQLKKSLNQSDYYQLCFTILQLGEKSENHHVISICLQIVKKIKKKDDEFLKQIHLLEKKLTVN